MFDGRLPDLLGANQHPSPAAVDDSAADIHVALAHPRPQPLMGFPRGFPHIVYGIFIDLSPKCSKQRARYQSAKVIDYRIMDSDLKNGVSRGSGSTWQRLSSKIWRPKSPGSASGAVQSRRAGSDAVPAGNGSGTLTTLITPKNPDSVVEEDGNQGAKNELSGRESSINDELASAYEIAWLSFDENQQNELSDRETIALLFEKLNATDKQHRQNSLLRKGLSAVKPFLDVVSVIIDFVSPVASLQPGAATGLGVAKGALSVCS